MSDSPADLVKVSSCTPKKGLQGDDTRFSGPGWSYCYHISIIGHCIAL